MVKLFDWFGLIIIASLERFEELMHSWTERAKSSPAAYQYANGIEEKKKSR